MKLEVGKKYRNRKGEIVTIISDDRGYSGFPYRDNTGYTYTEKGIQSYNLSISENDLIEEVKTMFKKGDRVRCIQEFSNGRMHTHGVLNEIYVVKVDQESPGSVNIENLGLLSSSRFELVTSELDELIETALNGFKALQKLKTEYKGQFKHTNPMGVELTSMYYEGLDAHKIVKVELPKFEPYTIGRWNVELRNDVLYIGCKQFDAKILAHDLNILASSTDTSRNELYANRKGINYKNYSLTWEQVDTLLEKLKKAGF